MPNTTNHNPPKISVLILCQNDVNHNDVLDARNYYTKFGYPVCCLSFFPLSGLETIVLRDIPSRCNISPRMKDNEQIFLDHLLYRYCSLGTSEAEYFFVIQGTYVTIRLNLWEYILLYGGNDLVLPDLFNYEEKEDWLWWGNWATRVHKSRLFCCSSLHGALFSHNALQTLTAADPNIIYPGFEEAHYTIRLPSLARYLKLSVAVSNLPVN